VSEPISREKSPSTDKGHVRSHESLTVSEKSTVPPQTETYLIEYVDAEWQTSHVDDGLTGVIDIIPPGFSLYLNGSDDTALRFLYHLSICLLLS